VLGSAEAAEAAVCNWIAPAARMRAAAIASVAGRAKDRFIVNPIVHPGAGAGAPTCMLLFGAVQLRARVNDP
jgi:hypothetical protein